MLQSAALGPVHQCMVHQDKRKQGFDDRCRAYAHTGIVTPQRLDLHRFAGPVDGAALDTYAGSRLDRDRRRQRLPGRDPPQPPAGMIADEAVTRECITRRGTELPRTTEPTPDGHASA